MSSLFDRYVDPNGSEKKDEITSFHLITLYHLDTEDSQNRCHLCHQRSQSDWNLDKNNQTKSPEFIISKVSQKFSAMPPLNTIETHLLKKKLHWLASFFGDQYDIDLHCKKNGCTLPVCLQLLEMVQICQQYVSHLTQLLKRRHLCQRKVQVKYKWSIILRHYSTIESFGKEKYGLDLIRLYVYWTGDRSDSRCFKGNRTFHLRRQTTKPKSALNVQLKVTFQILIKSILTAPENETIIAEKETSL